MPLILLAAGLLAPSAVPSSTPICAAILDLFEPRRDLAGFKEAMDGDYARLYNLAPFERADGRDLSPTELSEIRRRWTSERERVAVRIRSIETDPVEAFVFEAEWRLAKLGVFERAGLERVDGTPPIVYFAEPPMRSKAEQKAALLTELDPWGARMEALFQELYADPLKLQRAPGRGATGICILQTAAQYGEFAKLDGSRAASDAQACYDTTLGVAVTYLGGKGLPELLGERRVDLLRAQATGTLYAHKAADADLESWLAIGLPAYLAHHEGKTPKALDVRTLDPEWIGWICRLLRPEARRVLLPGLADLTRISGPGAYDRWVEPRYREKTGRGLKDHWGEVVHDAHAATLVYFLHRGAKGRYAEGFRRYLGLALAGSGGPEPLRRCLGVDDLRQVDDEFVAFAAERYAARYPGHPLESLEAIFPEDQPKATKKRPKGATKKPSKRDASRGGSDRETSRQSKETQKSAPAPALTAPAPTAAAAMGAAAGHVASGATAAAAESLRVWLADYGETEGADRVAKELERVERFRALRHQVVAQLMAKGKKLSVQLPAGKVIASIESLEGEIMQLGRNRLKLKALAFDDVPSRQWSGLMFDRRKLDLEPEPAMLLGLAVHGAGALEDAPKRFEIPEEWSLSARVEYPRARRDAELQAALNLLGEAPGSHSVEELFAAVDALLAPGPLASVEMAGEAERLAKDVRRVAVARLAALYRRRSLDQLLAAKVTEDLDGLVTLSWDFESEDQIRDFRPGVPTLLNELTAGIHDIHRDDPLHIEGGQLVGSGATSLLSLIELEAVEASWSTHLGEETSGALVYFDVALNLSDSGDHVGASGLRFISVQKGGRWGSDEGTRTLGFGINGPMTLRMTEGGWDLADDGKVFVSSTRAAPKKGRIAITNASHHGRALENLVVSGYCQDDARKRLAEEVARRDAAERGWLK